MTASDKMDTGGISLMLTPGQVTLVLKAAGGTRGQFRQFSLLAEEHPRELLASPLLEDRKISQSLLIGLVVLVSFPLDGSERANKDISLELGIAASTAHRYIYTLVAAGLLEQDPVTRCYRRTGLSSTAVGKRKA
jgi:DNA-binding MarR family transcriptional regulator